MPKQPRSILLHARRHRLLLDGHDLAILPLDARVRVRAHDDPTIIAALLTIAHRAPAIAIIRVPQQTAVVMRERVRFLAVDGPVADFEFLVAHAQRHAADVFDEDHDQGGPHQIPADNEERADDLQPDLLAVAGDGAAGVGEAEGGAAFGGGPETCGKIG